LEKNFSFAVEDIQRINLSEYEDDEFAVAKMGYLSTKPNSHGLKISEKVLRESASTVLNKWLVADMTGIVDAGTHTKEEKIVGRIPKEQDVEFVYDDDGYLRAYVDVVISKIYAKDFCKIFEEENNRAVSVEMRVLSNEDDENLVESFKIVGVTTLGKQIRPSCPDSDIEFTRFSQEEADKFFSKVHNNSLTVLKKFVEERKHSMAEKKYVSHPINTSKDAVYTGEWDGNKAKQDLIKERNYKSLAPKVCLNLEEGWEGREVTKLGYPVMGLFDGEWRYSTRALASALAYAKQNDEQEVLNKLKEIYDELDLNEEGKEDDEKMSKEVAFAAVDLNCPEEFKHLMGEEGEPKDEPDEKDAIIMQKDAEIDELRKELDELKAYKVAIEEKEIAKRVEDILDEVKDYLDDDKYQELRTEGLACSKDEIDAFSNKVKAQCFNAFKKAAKKNADKIFAFSKPIEIQKKDMSTMNVWDRIKENY
jgi:hypothetical protein